MKDKSAEKLVDCYNNFKRLSVVMSMCLSWLVFYDVPSNTNASIIFACWPPSSLVKDTAPNLIMS